MRKIRKIVAIVLAALMTFSVPTVINANTSEISVIIDGQPVVFAGQQPVIVGEQTLVPVRGVFEALGFEVEWDCDEQLVTLWNDDHTLLVTIGSYEFFVNYVRHTFDVAPQLIGWRTMLPIRALVESIGHEVEWDEATSTIVITQPTTPALVGYWRDEFIGTVTEYRFMADGTASRISISQSWGATYHAGTYTVYGDGYIVAMLFHEYSDMLGSGMNPDTSSRRGYFRIETYYDENILTRAHRRGTGGGIPFIQSNGAAFAEFCTRKNQPIEARLLGYWRSLDTEYYFCADGTVNAIMTSSSFYTDRLYRFTGTYIIDYEGRLVITLNYIDRGLGFAQLTDPEIISSIHYIQFAHGLDRMFLTNIVPGVFGLWDMRYIRTNGELFEEFFANRPIIVPNVELLAGYWRSDITLALGRDRDIEFDRGVSEREYRFNADGSVYRITIDDVLYRFGFTTDSTPQITRVRGHFAITEYGVVSVRFRYRYTDGRGFVDLGGEWFQEEHFYLESSEEGYILVSTRISHGFISNSFLVVSDGSLFEELN